MGTLLLHPRYDPDSQILWQAAVAKGWRVVRSQSYSAEGKIDALYGGYMWGESVAAQLGLPLMVPDDDWLTTVPYALSKRVTIKSVVSQVVNFPVFAKSLRGKTIASRVYHSSDDFPPGSRDEAILVQPVRDMAFEYRAFVLDGAILAASCYAKDGELFVVEMDEASPMRNWMDGTAACLAPSLPRACVIDFGILRNGARCVIEANPAWCSGLYACDPSQALAVIGVSCGAL